MSTLDSKDLKILQILQEEGKITNSEIADRVGFANSTISERIKKLENDNYIEGYHAVLNSTFCGLNYQAFINITISRKKDGMIDSFLEKIEMIDEVVECFRVIGKFDFILRVITFSAQSFEQLLEDNFGRMREIKNLEAQNILSIPKNKHTLPLKYDQSDN